MSVYKKFTKYVTLIGLINITGQLKGIIVLPIITKLLGAMDFGIWTQLRVTVNLLTPFILLDLPSSIVRFLAAEKNKEEIQEVKTGLIKNIINGYVLKGQIQDVVEVA